MSISGLSNHLCVTVATITSLIVASSTFHQARASNDSYDFTDSRQYKRNLAVSKFREDPHWLSNYTWKPPEKFYGPRNRPPWEVDAVPETEAQRKEREELEKWENEMREVTRRQREKWKMYEANGRSEASSSEEIPMTSDDDLQQTGESKLKKESSKPRKSSHLKKRKHWGNQDSKKSNGEIKESVADLPNGLHNGRWGMSNITPNAPGVFKETKKSSKKPNKMSQINDETVVPTSLSNGRWGMSVEGAPTTFIKEAPEKSSEISLMHGSTASTVSGNQKSRTSGQLNVPVALQSNRRGMNVKEVPQGFLKDALKPSKRLRTSNSAHKRNHHEKSADYDDIEATTKLPKSFFNDRWGMKVEKPSREVSSKEASTTVSQPNAIGQSVHSGKLGEKIEPSTFSNGRWGMSTKEVPEEFLKMSRRFLPLRNANTASESRKPTRSKKIHIAQENSGKTENEVTGTATSELPNGFPSGRWGMSVSSPPKDFIKNISSGRSTIPNGDIPETFHVRVEKIAKDNPLPRESTISTVSKIPNDDISINLFLNFIKAPRNSSFFGNSKMHGNLPTLNIQITVDRDSKK